jgi:hypothetical protein
MWGRQPAHFVPNSLIVVAISMASLKFFLFRRHHHDFCELGQDLTSRPSTLNCIATLVGYLGN